MRSGHCLSNGLLQILCHRAVCRRSLPSWWSAFAAATDTFLSQGGTEARGSDIKGRGLVQPEISVCGCFHLQREHNEQRQPQNICLDKSAVAYVRSSRATGSASAQWTVVLEIFEIFMMAYAGFRHTLARVVFVGQSGCYTNYLWVAQQ
jgi:hypothetical protein